MNNEEDILDTYVNDGRSESARRGAVTSNKGKTRVTMYLDNDVLEHFREVATASGRGYQTEINKCLKQALTTGAASISGAHQYFAGKNRVLSERQDTRVLRGRGLRSKSDRLVSVRRSYSELTMCLERELGR